MPISTPPAKNIVELAADRLAIEAKRVLDAMSPVTHTGLLDALETYSRVRTKQVTQQQITQIEAES